ncbi:MAG: transporter [Yoonia sp.]|nr:transporter [Yoonia sp.]
MKNTLTIGAALLLTTSAAFAGGIDRSGQSIGAIFEEGSYAELSYGSVTPSITGSILGGNIESGNIAPSYGQLGLAYKRDVNDRVSVALIIDQPFGAAVAYGGTTYPLAGTSAEVNATSTTAVGRYKFNDNVSVHFGPRYLAADGNYTLAVGGGTLYTSTYEQGTGSGYVAGVAYERKDIALRVALTYSSAIDLELEGSAGDLNATMPKSWNLDFQSGVAADTLVFGSIRHVGWSKAVIRDAAFGDLVTYDQDTTSYTLGVGRKFSDSFSGALSVGYEEEQGGTASNLAPTDGNMSIGIGGTYTMDTGIALTGGIRYVMTGDASSDVPISQTEETPSDFSDNSAIAIGLKVAYSF